MVSIHTCEQPNYDISSASETITGRVLFFCGGWGGSIHEASMPCWTRPGFLVCWQWRFVVSAVRAELNRWGRSFVWGFCQSPEPLCLWMHLPPIWKTPSFFYTPSTPCVSARNYPLLLCLPPCPNAFLQGRLLFIPSGGLTVNLLHLGEISGNGARISGYPASAPRSGTLSIHLCISPLICLSE